MNCPHCNNEAPDTNYRCPHCGNILKPDVEPSDFRKEPVKRSFFNANIVVLAIIVVGLGFLVYAAFFRTTGKSEPQPAAAPELSRSQTAAPQEAPAAEPGKNESQPRPADPDKASETPFFKETGEEKPDDIKPKKPEPGTSKPSPSRADGRGYPPGYVINSQNPGEEINIEEFVQAGKTTIFDFYSEYCGPCRKFSPMLKQLDSKRDDIVVLKVDINRSGRRGIDWNSPVARQYRLGSIPHFVIYDSSGTPAYKGDSAYGEVSRLLMKEGIVSRNR